jgi:hypothetical protein
VLDEAKNPKVDANDLYNFKRGMLKEFKDAPFEDFLTYINSDTLLFQWHKYPLPKTRYVDRSNLQKNVGPTRVFKYVPTNTHQTVNDSLEKECIIPVRTKPNTSDKQAEKLIKGGKNCTIAVQRKIRTFTFFLNRYLPQINNMRSLL